MLDLKGSVKAAKHDVRFNVRVRFLSREVYIVSPIRQIMIEGNSHFPI